MKSIIMASLYAALFGGLGLFSAAAQADELRVGIMNHDVDVPKITGRSLKEESVSLTGEYIFDTPNWPKWTLGARPYVYGSLNLEGNTSHGGVGLNWRAHFADKFYAEIGGGLSVHSGTNHIDSPSAADLNGLTQDQRIALLATFFERERTEIEFGSRALFRGQLTIGYDINDKWGAEIAYEHLSNARILDSTDNEALDSFGVRLTRKF